MLTTTCFITPKGGKVTLSAKTNGDKSVEMSIKDTGIGMSSAIVDNLFRLDVQTNRIDTESEEGKAPYFILPFRTKENNGLMD